MDDPYAVDAAYYDLIHADAPDDDVGLWLSFAGRTTRPVLEVGAGTGRIALELAASGATVTALDPSQAMLAQARAKAAARGLAVDWRAGTPLSAPLESERYGLIILPADIFLYCADGHDQAATLIALGEALAFDGILAIDLPGPALWLDDGINGQPIHVFAGETPDGHLDVFHIAADDLAAQTRHLRILYDLAGADGVVRRTASDHRLRYVYPFELEYLFRLVGLSPLDVYGDYDLGPLTGGSDRMVATARKVDR